MDAEAIFSNYGQDESVSRYLIWRPHRTIEDTKFFIQHCLDQPVNFARTYALCERSTGALAGTLDIRLSEPHRMEIGYVLARAFWGQGLMTEAATSVVDWAFNQPDISRVSGACDVENSASEKVLQKIGMQREGRLRRWLVAPNIGGAARDYFLYSKVR